MQGTMIPPSPEHGFDTFEVPRFDIEPVVVQSTAVPQMTAQQVPVNTPEYDQRFESILTHNISTVGSMVEALRAASPEMAQQVRDEIIQQSFLVKIAKFFTLPAKADPQRELLRKEAATSVSLFTQEAGQRSDFFCLDRHTWIWHESRTDTTGKPISVTTRYEVRPSGVVKAQDGHGLEYVRGQELINLEAFTKVYYREVAAKVYNRQPTI